MFALIFLTIVVVLFTFGIGTFGIGLSVALLAMFRNVVGAILAAFWLLFYVAFLAWGYAQIIPQWIAYFHS